MKRALFPGSFAPPSLGHFDIIQRGSKLCDELIVGVAHNPEKEATISSGQKAELLRIMTRELPNVRVEVFDGLAVHFAREQGVTHLLRGLRAFSDFEYEFRMALANRKLSGIETLFLMADPRLSHISSTLIRDIARNGARLKDFVPEAIEDQVFHFFHDS
ncbi:MAG: pantetheine-phosphate adenylyltransferase [Chlamydiia bacterium]|nr:pantetheine-phosphate adenylyltransferase [Chlamydiia bacterium]